MDHHTVTRKLSVLTLCVFVRHASFSSRRLFIPTDAQWLYVPNCMQLHTRVDIAVTVASLMKRVSVAMTERLVFTVANSAGYAATLTAGTGT
jgi:hypothetical protein